MKFYKKYLLIAFICIAFSLGSSFAQTNNFGFGIILGSPTGLSGKYWSSSINAFDFGLGYSFEKNSRIHLHGDFLFHIDGEISSSGKIAIYYGPGIRLKFREDNNSSLGARGVLGGLWMPRGTKIDVFVEIAPVMDLIPSTNFTIDGGIGLRFFLN